MSGPVVVGLMLVAGVCHAGWNLLAKRLETDHTLFLVAVGPIAFLLTAPWAIGHLPGVWWPTAGYVVARVALNAVYVVFLARAYRGMDLSQAYPLARGTGPLVATALAVVVLGERPSALGVAGVIVISVAIWSFGLRPSAEVTVAPVPRLRALMWPLLTGLTIGCYTVLDKAAVGVMDPITYFSLVELGTGLLLGGIVLVRGQGGSLRRVARVNWRPLLGCSLLVVGSYALALIALTHAYASYVAPLREVAVLYAVLFGVLLLREPHGARRIPSAVAMVVGLVMVGVSI